MTTPSLKVLQVSAEIFPLLKTGGLADIAGALPAALKAVGCDVRLLLPGFTPILQDLQDATLLAELTTPWGESVRLRQGRLATLDAQAYVIDAPALYRRPGSPYEDAQRQPYADNYRRFALLGWMAGQLAQSLDASWQPQVVHSHDWHAALAPAYLAFSREHQPQRVASVFTVHNLAYQGVFAPQHFCELGLPDAAFSVEGLEYHGQISFMKAGLYYADRITTVSPTYAKEIQTPEQGCGLDGLLRTRAGVLSGILNAVDETVWNPATDSALASHYDAAKSAGKARCKSALQRELGLKVRTRAPLFGVVSRLTEQKGLHLVLGAIDEILDSGGQLVVLGSGEGWLEAALRAQAERHPKSVAVHVGYDEALAHRIFAATDVTLVPSRFEPCGLTQMYGLKYGSLPLVRRVGGLADTVVDSSLEDLAAQRANGFVFEHFSPQGFAPALQRAFALYARPEEWAAVAQGAMRQHFGWESSAAKYLALYRAITA
jgi:starch synthase